MRHLNDDTRPVSRLLKKLGAVALGVILAATLLDAGPAAAATTGTLKGRVVNATTGEPQGGVALRLIAARPDGGDRSTTRAVSDPAGRYVFEDLETGPTRVYALEARFRGGLFAGAPIRLPGDTTSPPVVASKLRVWNTTTDPRAITVARNDLFVVPDEDHVGVIESVKVINATERAYIGRARAMGVDGSRAGPPPSLGFSLPRAGDRDSVVISSTDLTGPPPVTTEFGFAASVAIPPGETSTTFSYRLEGTGGVFDLSRTALYPTAELSVYATEPLEVEGNRLARRGSRTIGGVDYRIWATGDTVAAGDTVQVVATAEAGAAPGLIMGLSAFLSFVSGLGLLALWRRRKRRRSPAGSSRRATSAPTAGAAAAAQSSSSGQPSPLGEGEEVRSAPGARPPAANPQRAGIIDAIAELDIDFDNGDIPKEQWLERRTALKKVLASMSSEPRR